MLLFCLHATGNLQLKSNIDIIIEIQNLNTLKNNRGHEISLWQQPQNKKYFNENPSGKPNSAE